MKTLKGLGLPGLLLAVLLLLASCGGVAGGGGQGDGGINGGKKGEGDMGGMEGMDHGSMGSMGSEKMARQMVSPGGEYSDKAFIDAMVPHHESAISMANVALEESKNEEIRGISEDIVKAQKQEISQMRSWRQQWYPEG